MLYHTFKQKIKSDIAVADERDPFDVFPSHEALLAVQF